MGSFLSTGRAYKEVESGYNLKHLVSPTVSGPLLPLLAFLVEHVPGVNYLIAKDSGLYSLRSLKLDETPTQFPFDGPTFLEWGKLNLKAQTKREVEQVLMNVEKTPSSPFNSSKDFHVRYLSGDLSPIDIAKKFIIAVQKDEEDLEGKHAMLLYDIDEILLQAEASAERYRSKAPLSIFDGLLVAVKDEMDAVPYLTNVGTTFINLRPTRDAWVVEKLRNAGCVIVGKTRMHEFGLDVTGCNPGTGTPKNAYNSLHWAGGSSSGSGAIVGSGLLSLAIGADGGGSIRIPASYNGVYGLKATGGRISSRGGFEIDPSVGVIGPIASNAADLAFAYFLCAGTDPEDPHTTMQPPVTIASYPLIKSLKGVKMGVYWPYFQDSAPEIVEACKMSLARFEALGAEVVEIELPGLEELRNSHTITITSEMLYGTSHLPRGQMGFPTRIALATFESLNAGDYIRAAKIRTRGMNMLRDVFAKVDLIVTPTAGITAPKIPEGALSHGLSDYTTSGQAMKYVFLANGCGLPAVTVPVGYGKKDGMPIGLQFQAKWFNEDLLLRMAHASEHAHASILRAPSSVVDLLA